MVELLCCHQYDVYKYICTRDTCAFWFGLTHLMKTCNSSNTYISNVAKTYASDTILRIVYCDNSDKYIII